MRCTGPVVHALAALSLFSSIVSCQSAASLARRHSDDIYPRAEDTTTASSSAHTASRTSSKTSSILPTQTQTRTKTTSTPESSATDITSTTPTAFSTTGGDGTSEVYHGGLPIQPRITPGLGIAGVILILAGVAYGLVGIKVKRLHIFFSTAFLTSLSVTVLIVYVMNPPVSNATQGGYVTAVVVTGIVLGGLANIFPEVTEGLGCLLGGFCLAMWFLVLKPGGLITSEIGKVILIAVLCVVCFILAFHRLTKPYALIGSLSFAGATAMVLGIDCFTRAGLKEFWLYIWDLNSNMWPLNTNTYPHTRGIRVEIAAIILIAALGVISQIKLWKILREHRAQKEGEKRQQEADLEALDEDAGRRVEVQCQAERVQWEALYGNKGKRGSTVDERPSLSRTDSGIGSVDDFNRKVRESIEFVETDKMKKGRESQIALVQRGESSDSVAARGALESTSELDLDRITPLETSDISMQRYSSSPLPSRRQSSQSTRSKANSSVLEPLAESVELKRLKLSPPPPIIPLPIPTMHETESEQEEDHGSSAATRADEEGARDVGPEDNASFGLPEIEYQNDRASSLLATCDMYTDDALGAMDSRIDLLAENDGIPHDSMLSEREMAHPNAGTMEVAPGDIKPSKIAEDAGIFEKFATDVTALELSDGLNANAADSVTPDRSSYQKSAAQEHGSGVQTPITSPMPASESSKNESKTRLPADLAPASFPKSITESTPSGDTPSVVAQLPAHCSKVVKTYRTNEWAKHLAEAEKPELEDLDKPVEHHENEDQEAPAPLDVEALTETAEIRPEPRRSSQSKSYKMAAAPTQDTPIPISKPTGEKSQARKSLARHGAHVKPNLQSGSTQNILERKESPPVDRTSSTSPPVEANKAKPAVRSASAAAWHTSAAFPSKTLMGTRDMRVHSKTSFNTLDQYSSIPEAPKLREERRSISANNLTRRTSAMNALNGIRRVQSPANALSPQDMNANIPTSPSPLNQVELDDDMPLARRRSELLHHSSSQQNIRTQTPVLQQQKRGSNPDKRAEILRSWRESIQTDQQKRNDTRNVDQRHSDLVHQYNYTALKDRQKTLHENLKEGVLDDMMRQPSMLELHKEALRKMQGKANKHL